MKNFIIIVEAPRGPCFISRMYPIEGTNLKQIESTGTFGEAMQVSEIESSLIVEELEALVRMKELPFTSICAVSATVN